MNQMQYLVHQIPFFFGKKASVYPGIYHNDAYPACLLVQDGIETYKVRFPGVLNKNSVQSEIGALKLLTEHGVVKGLWMEFHTLLSITLREAVLTRSITRSHAKIGSILRMGLQSSSRS